MEEIKLIRKKREELFRELNKLTQLLLEKEKQHIRQQQLHFFSKNVCSGCKDDLTEEEIISNLLFCQECLDSDSDLEHQ